LPVTAGVAGKAQIDLDGPPDKRKYRRRLKRLKTESYRNLLHFSAPNFSVIESETPLGLVWLFCLQSSGGGAMLTGVRRRQAVQFPEQLETHARPLILTALAAKGEEP
jgi:hypothetical protein